MKKFKNYSLGLLLAISLLACSMYGEKVSYNGTDVYYKEGVSKEIAKKVGAYLEDSGFSDGTTKSVQITKDSIYNFRMVTQEQYHEDTTLDVSLKALGMLLSKEVFEGQPINFVVCDNAFETIRTIPINGFKTN